MTVDCNLVALLGFAVFMGCVCIGFVLAAASLKANDDSCDDDES